MNNFALRQWGMKLFAAAAALGLLSDPAIPPAQAEPTMTEYQVKALFLFNFAKYVEWPAESFPAANAPFIIGVLGQDNFNNVLSNIVAGKTVNGRPILVKNVAGEAEMAACQILFISSSENSQLDGILARIGALPILTVGEQEEFWEKGGIINFILKENKVRLEVNLRAARLARVQISSKLLSVADVVKGKGN